MNRFIIPPGHHPGDIISLSPEESAHAARVLRLKPGAEIELIDGVGGKWRGALVDVQKDAVAAELKNALDNREPSVEITLFQGLPKFEKLDLIVQKATELGVRRVAPVTMERSVARLNRKDAEKRRERLQRIALEAAKQCGRARVPDICAPLSWAEALALLNESELRLMPWEEEHSLKLKNVYDQSHSPASIALLIGPEGGISAREADEAKECGAQPVSLGPRILRAETAAISALTLAMGLWGDLL